MQFEIINPISHFDWDNLILSTDNYSFFHSSAWARVLSSTYKYIPKYFVVIKNNVLEICVPMMEIDTFLARRKGVSLPFTDYCQPIGGNGQSSALLLQILEEGKMQNWNSIEIRGMTDNANKTMPYSSYYIHLMNLSLDEDKIFSSFQSNTKRNIKKAIKEGVQVKIVTNLKSIEAYYRLHCLTRKRHGLPPQPYSFFKNIYKYIIAKDYGFTIIATYNNRPVAAAIYFYFGNEAIYKYGASDFEHQSLRANNLVMWEAIRWFARKGFKNFSFGRTEFINEGLRRFKLGWGVNENTIQYFKFDYKKNAFVKESNLLSFPPHYLTKKLPIPILRTVGTMVYKHMG